MDSSAYHKTLAFMVSSYNYHRQIEEWSVSSDKAWLVLSNPSFTTKSPVILEVFCGCYSFNYARTYSWKRENLRLIHMDNEGENGGNNQSNRSWYLSVGL